MAFLDIGQLLQQGIVAMQAGDKALARSLLLQVVENEEHNEQAWYWLSMALDDPDDKIMALKNVLVLNPDHDAARSNLDWWRKRLEMMPTEESSAAEITEEEITTEDEAAAPAAISETPYAAVDLSTQLYESDLPTEEDASLTALASEEDEEDEEEYAPTLHDDGAYSQYQCIYCGYLTAPDDRRCPDCRRKLTKRRSRTREPSAMLQSARLVMTLLALIATLEMVFLLIIAVLIETGEVQTIEIVERVLGYKFFIGDPRALPTKTREWLQLANLVRMGLLGTVAAGLYARLSFAYYTGILVLIAELMFAAYRWANDYTGLGLLGVSAALALAGLYLVFSSDYDFAITEERLLTRPDAKGAYELSRRGVKYSQEGKWGLAVAHFQAAVNAMPEKPEFFKELALGYMQIGRYQRALNALAEAKRQAPHDSEVPELVAMVKDRQTHDTARGGEWWREI